MCLLGWDVIDLTKYTSLYGLGLGLYPYSFPCTGNTITFGVVEDAGSILSSNVSILKRLRVRP